MAPFPIDLTPPIKMPGFCDSVAFSSSNWQFTPSQGGDWIAKPANAPVSLENTEQTCVQKLDGLDIMTRVKEAAGLRLHFSGCNKPSSIFTIHLTTGLEPSTGTGEPTVQGIPLLDFVCSVSPGECSLAREKIRQVQGMSEDDLKMDKGKVGLGRCSGEGVTPHEVAAVSTAADCSSECQQRIVNNLKNPSTPSCRGYAWSEPLTSCIVYDGWPISASEGSSGEGYFCDNMTAVKSKAAPQAPTTAAPVLEEAVTLDLSKLFEDQRAITVRRFAVSPFTPNCFANFNWYILDRWLHVSESDLKILEEIGKANGTVADSAVPPPRPYLTVERVCVRDCNGNLRGECEAEESAHPSAATYVPTSPARAPARAPAAPRVPAAAPTQQGGDSSSSWLQDVMGEAAFEAFSDEANWPWFGILALLSMLLGMTLTCCCCSMGSGKSQRPKNLTVEELKLVYEGDEEETVALRTSADGTMMSMTGSMMGLGATWQPTKADAERATSQRATAMASFNSAMGSKQPMRNR